MKKYQRLRFETRELPFTNVITRMDALAGFKSYFVKLRIIVMITRLFRRARDAVKPCKSTTMAPIGWVPVT